MHRNICDDFNLDAILEELLGHLDLFDTMEQQDLQPEPDSAQAKVPCLSLPLAVLHFFNAF